jgi:AcrR family transcriptional regulator
MDGLACSDGKGTPTRSRGRPSLETAARIDREILHAARDLFLSHGYQRTSMAMVTCSAGVSKTTLYARYATKADLFRATVLLTVERNANQTLIREGRDAHELEPGLKLFGYEALRISLAPFWSSYERLVYSEGARFPELTGAVIERTEIGIQTIAMFIQACADRDGSMLTDPVGVAAAYVLSLRGFYTAAVLRGRTPGEEEIRIFVDRLVGLMMAARAVW